MQEQKQCLCEECQSQCQSTEQVEPQEEECSCPDCEHERLIEECLEILLDENACTDCVVQAVVEMAFKSRALGYEEARDEMRELLE